MAALGKKLRSLQGGLVAFMCPGCGTIHVVRVSGSEHVWDFNGDGDSPTFAPSIFVNKGGINPTHPICHSFVRNGHIQFLGDCSHALAGQTVPLPEFDDARYD